LGRID
jgi:hypothetical protein